MFVKVAPFLFVCLWATGFIGARLGMPYAEPGTFLALRFALAFVLLAMIAAFSGAPRLKGRVIGQALIIGMLIHGIYLGAVFWAIDQDMPAGITAVIVGLQPLLTAILAGWWLHEPISKNHWLGLFIGLIGVLFVIIPGFDWATNGINVQTVTVTFIGMLSVTLGTVLQKLWAGQSDLRSHTSFQYLGAFIPVFLLSLTTEQQHIQWQGELIFALVWLVLVLSIAAILLLMWLIRNGSVAKVSSLFYMVPAVASLMAYVLFDEVLSPLQLFGMALCAVAVILATIKTKHAKQPLSE